MNQTDQILAVLKERGAISPMTALKEIGCMRLAARISELRTDHKIETEMVESESRGRTVRHAVYRLIK